MSNVERRPLLENLEHFAQSLTLPVRFVEQSYLTAALVIGILLSIIISRVVYPLGVIAVGAVMLLGGAMLWWLPIRKTKPDLWLTLVAMELHFCISLFITPLIIDYYAKTSGDDSTRYVEVGKELSALLVRDPALAINLFTRGATLWAAVDTPAAFQWIIALFAFASGGTGIGIGIMCAWLGTLGSYHFLQAYRSLKFESGWEWYALLVLFSPSILFWTTLPLKDVLTFWVLGVLSFNLATYFQSRSYITLIKIIAIEAACFAIRPYFCAFVTIPIILWCTWEVTRNWRNRSSWLQVIWLLTGNVVLLYFLVLNGFFLGLAIDSSNIQKFATGYQSSVGEEPNIKRAAATISPPTIQPGMPEFSFPVYIAERSQLVFAVLYRPVPWEAHNSFALMSSLENTVLLILSLLTIGRVKQVLMISWRSPLLWFAGLFAMLFVGAYSFQVFNLGTMSRARINVLPFLFIFFALALNSMYPARRWAERLFA